MTARLALAALLATAPLAAQANSDARLTALRLLRPGEMLRFHVHRVGTLHGVFVQFDSTTVLVRDRLIGRNLPILGIDSIWRRENHRPQGTVMGLIAGGIAGGLFGAFFGNTTCHCANPASGRYGVRGVVLGMSFGAVIGTVAGGAVTRWERWYP